MDYVVNARAIRRWAEQLAARSSLPQVIRRLVQQTMKDVSRLDFPANDSAQRSGFDGEIVCETGNAWVPAGRSVWELGVNVDVKGKADEDFAKRTAETSLETRQQTAFVFLTPRHWEHKKEWAEAHKGVWKEVREYDADNLEQWLEAAPAVAVWFGRIIGSRPLGVDDVVARWDALSGCAMRPLLPSVFLVGRKETLDKLQAWLAGLPDHFCIQSRSPGEVIDFFCAATAGMAEADRSMVEARSIIVEQLDAWRMLRDAHTPAILVVDPAVAVSSEDVSRAVSNGHHVLLAVEPGHFTTSKGTALERPGQFDLTQALEQCGYEPVPAEQFARAAGGSLAVLKHLVARVPAATMPAWSTSISSDNLSSCLLLGGWDGGNEADRGVRSHCWTILRCL